MALAKAASFAARPLWTKKLFSVPKRYYGTPWAPTVEGKGANAVHKVFGPVRVVLPSPLVYETDPSVPFQAGDFENFFNLEGGDKEFGFATEYSKERTKPEPVEERIARLYRFKQAIIARYEELQLPYDPDLEPNEFPMVVNMKAAFGTPERPVLVPSLENERIVGCQGGAGPLHHDVKWHLVKKNKPLCCIDCGQIFRLVNHYDWLEWAAAEWELRGQDTVRFFLHEED